MEPSNPVYYKAKSIHDFIVTDLYGEYLKLDVYEGFVCIIVNTATYSKLTDIHYKQFNELMDEFSEKDGLRILAFPCNQFGNEEPCTSEEILEHAEDNNVKFDIFAKVNVNCNGAIPLYKYLKSCLGGQRLGDMIKWSYTKFIVNRKGIPMMRYGPEVFPFEMKSMLKIYLSTRYPRTSRKMSIMEARKSLHEASCRILCDTTKDYELY